MNRIQIPPSILRLKPSPERIHRYELRIAGFILALQCYYWFMHIFKDNDVQNAWYILPLIITYRAMRGVGKSLGE